MAFLLADEANKFKRWKEEFRQLFKKDRIIMIYGSAIKNYAQARDIDIMAVSENLPSINLEWLDLRGTKTKILPEAITELKNLSWLFIDAEKMNGNSSELIKKLNEIAISQMQILTKDKNMKKLENKK